MITEAKFNDIAAALSVIANNSAEPHIREIALNNFRKMCAWRMEAKEAEPCTQ